MSTVDLLTQNGAEWTEPRDIAEAREFLDAATAEVLSIQDQLSRSKTFREDFHGFATKTEWDDWRKRALTALRFRVIEQRNLKNWIRDRSGSNEPSFAVLLGAVILRLDTIIDLLRADGDR